MLAIVHVLPPFEATCVHRGYLKGEKSPGELNCAPSEFSMLLDTNNNGLISFAVFCMYAYAWRQAHYLYVMLIKLLKHLLILHFVITGILFLLHHLTYQNQVFQLPSKCLILTMMGRFDVYVSVINLHKLLDVPHTILLCSQCQVIWSIWTANFYVLDTSVCPSFISISKYEGIFIPLVNVSMATFMLLVMQICREYRYFFLAVPESERIKWWTIQNYMIAYMHDWCEFDPNVGLLQIKYWPIIEMMNLFPWLWPILR